ncbi:hypothetical protein [Rariglobus hedericola]|uniref:DUF3352 domain-containing protein n=1 Tax=Rariglobus hedericola TaxID=2597822 RepID=A0A556QN93_9BACT|nr:hypothetical protein [Rariglobus hedericola]TSJ78120.1 hypothetical protein FPL22_02065 [Rariglobus hedericola]
MIRPIIASAFFTSASLLIAVPAVPLVNLVDDQTLAVVSVSDAPALLRGWDAGPLAKTWNDPQVVKFLTPFREEIKIDEWDAETKTATGLTVRELLALAKGEVLIAVPSFKISTMEKKSPPPFLAVLEVGDDSEKIEKILAESLAKKSLQEETELFSGVKVHIRPLAKKATDEKTDDATEDEADEIKTPGSFAWAMSDGLWFISLDKERVFAAIDALKQGGVNAALGKTERYLRTRQRVGQAQALVYVNFPAVYPLVRDAVAESKAKSAAKPNMMGIDSEAVLNALGLDVLGESYFSLETGANETNMDFGLTYTEERGLVKLIAYQPGTALRPDWIAAKWPSVSTGRFSVPKAYAALAELLESISPMMSGMAQGQIRAFNKKIGIDIERDLIGSLGEDIVTAYVIPSGTPDGSVPAWTDMDQLFAMTLANEATFIKAVEALKRLAGPAADQMFTKRDYLGNTLYTLNLPPTPEGMKARRGFSYAIANGTFLLGVGSAASVESALQGMSSNQGLFWKRDDVKAVVANFPADAVGIQVQDMRFIVDSLIEMAVQYQTAENEGVDEADQKKHVDISARPDAELIGRYWGLSGGYVLKTPEGLFTKTRIVHPQP